MKKYCINELSSLDLVKLYSRPQINFDEIKNLVTPILEEVKKWGLDAVVGFAKKYDNLSSNIIVTEEEILNSENLIDDRLKEAIQLAKKNIESFHLKQKLSSYEIEIIPGVVCSREPRPIESVGLYIPGGTAVLPSTMLMLSIPAVIAKCKRIVVCTPAEDEVSSVILYCAKLLGIKEIYKAGGAQAIGLMAYGSAKENISKVDKIFGPGNQFVTTAKMLISIDNVGCTIDMPAGPSEVLIIADETSNAKYVAADLLSQAEHGNDSQTILVTPSENLVDEVQNEIKEQLKILPRYSYIQKSLTNSFSLIVNNIYEAIDFSNSYAPEHLILNFKDADLFKDKIINAGSVFIGNYTPESAGDYSSGTNHSLPTYGYSKSLSGIGVESFCKYISFQKINKEGLFELSKSIIPLAEVEKLDAHKNAVTIRLKND